MTLADLVKKATLIGNAFNTADVPLMWNGKPIDVDFVPSDDGNGGYVMDMSIYVNQ